MTDNKLIDFFINKLNELENLSPFRVFVARRLPIFPTGMALNKWRLIIILSGERLYRFADGKQVIEVKLQKGDILMVQPFSRIWCEEDQTYDMLSIVCNPSLIRLVSKCREKGILMATNPDAVLHGGQAGAKCLEFLLEALDQVFIRKDHPDPDYLLKFICLECRAAVLSSIHVPQTGPQYLLENIIAFIGKHLTEDLSCSRLANEFCISANYVAQLFAREMSCGFSEYIRNQRLELARMLLKNTNMNVGEIASYCGFSQASYFIFLYKKKYGFTPLGYRTEIE